MLHKLFSFVYICFLLVYSTLGEVKDVPLVHVGFEGVSAILQKKHGQIVGQSGFLQLDYEVEWGVESSVVLVGVGAVVYEGLDDIKGR